MKAIVCVDNNWGIGKDNKLLFSLPADMKFFRQTTTGNVVVMGSKTLASFPGGKPLKNRTNIVLSRALKEIDGCIVADGIDELFVKLADYPSDSVYVIGGASIYNLLLPHCSEVLVTKVQADGNADTFFPNLEKSPDFRLVSTSDPVVDNGYTITFNTYKNIKL
jgi:dihydrofolate reductase